MCVSANHTETESAVPNIFWTTPCCVAGDKSECIDLFPNQVTSQFPLSSPQCLGDGHHRNLRQHSRALRSTPRRIPWRTGPRRTFPVLATLGRQRPPNGRLPGHHSQRRLPLPRQLLGPRRVLANERGLCPVRLPEHPQLSVVHAAADNGHLGSTHVGHTTTPTASAEYDQVGLFIRGSEFSSWPQTFVLLR